jgi:hypothetical protein
MLRLFLLLVTVVLRALRVAARSRSELVLENIALKQQVGVLKQKRSRPRLDDSDRAFWVAMRVAWRGWAKRLVIVEPDTVVKWHRERFRRYWTELSRPNGGPGRPRIEAEIRELINRMALDNDWGAPRIHGELQKLGFTVSEATISRYMPQRPANPDVVRRWLAFLRNHKDGIAAMDFFTVQSRLVARPVLLVRHPSPLRTDPSLQRHLQPERRLGDPAAARSIPLRYRAETSDLRLRLDLQPGRGRVRQVDGHETMPNLLPQPLAESRS